jgi:hypothetical protein
MAEPLDPKLYYATSEEATTAGYSSPIEAKFAEWLKTAEPGDTFDWFAETAIPTQKGESSKFVGTGTQGKPIVESITSAEKTNWRAALVGAKSQEEAINNLINLGYAADVASFLVRRGNIRKTGNGTTSSVSSDGSTAFNPVTGLYTASDGKTFTNVDSYNVYQSNLDTKKGQRQSAYDLLLEQFNQYGLGALVTPLKGLIESNVSPSEFALRLRDTDAYKKRFAANAQRINQGLRALSESEYIALEDQYQDIMRRYGLPQSYYTRGDMGIQQGFEKFIAGDVSAAELEDRIQTAQNRVINAAPEVTQALKQFYPDITNSEILAYTLDPTKAIEEIKRKVTAAEIGAGAMQAGLSTGATRAEELARYGVTGQAARQGYQAIASFLPRATQLSDIYRQGPYTQTTAEAEVFGTTGAAEAERKRKELTQLETAQFSGQTGVTKGALARERAGQF